jgi:hypothetical protein
MAMNRLSLSRKDSVEYASAISVCTRDVVRHTKITPHAFPVVRLFTEPARDNGPNRSNAVDQNGGDGPMACAGKGAMIYSPSFLSLFLHIKHAFFTALAFKCALMIHTLDLVVMIMGSMPAWSFLCAFSRYSLDNGWSHGKTRIVCW